MVCLRAMLAASCHASQSCSCSSGYASSRLCRQLAATGDAQAGNVQATPTAAELLETVDALKRAAVRCCAPRAGKTIAIMGLERACLCSPSTARCLGEDVTGDSCTRLPNEGCLASRDSISLRPTAALVLRSKDHVQPACRLDGGEQARPSSAEA